MNKKQFTAEQLLTRWEIRREVQNIMGKYSQSYCIKQEGALPQFWSGRDDISLGLNQGYYIGQAAVNGYYAAIEAETKLASQLIAARFPQKLQGKTEEELFGVGQISYRPIDTAVIEVADDLQTAKGLWVVRGMVEKVTTSGPISYWDFSYWAVDFILEAGAWKIWHMTMFTDIQCPVGGNWGRDTMYPHEGVEIPEPTVKEHQYTGYGEDFISMVAPRLPEPYDTFANTFSY